MILIFHQKISDIRHCGLQLGFKESRFFNGIKVDNQISKSSHKEIHIAHLPCLIGVFDISVQCVKIEDIANQVLKE